MGRATISERCRSNDKSSRRSSAPLLLARSEKELETVLSAFKLRMPAYQAVWQESDSAASRSGWRRTLPQEPPWECAPRSEAPGLGQPHRSSSSEANVKTSSSASMLCRKCDAIGWRESLRAESATRMRNALLRIVAQPSHQPASKGHLSGHFRRAGSQRAPARPVGMVFRWQRIATAHGSATGGRWIESRLLLPAACSAPLQGRGGKRLHLDTLAGLRRGLAQGACALASPSREVSYWLHHV